MKKTFFFCVVLLGFTGANFAQENSSSAPVSVKKAQKSISFKTKKKVAKFYSKSELKNLDKSELVSIYLRRVQEITNLVPFLAMNQSNNMTFRDFGIRKRQDNVKMVNNYKTAANSYQQETRKVVVDFIPYTDTEDIVHSITYMDKIIKKMRGHAIQ